MRKLAQFFRILKINMIILRYGLDEIILKAPWFKCIRFIKYLNPWFFIYRRKPVAVRIRLAIEQLGPIVIKFGQMLSTRPDIFSEDIITELAKLRDRVPPFPGKQATAMIEAAFKKEISAIFQTFSETPLASASVAQVHEAILPTGEAVVVKILRPNVEKIIRGDIRLLKVLAKLVQKHWSEGKRLKPLEIVKEFEATLENELDLLREAANASQLRRNFDNSHLLYIPKIYWPFCKRNIMTLEKIHGIPVDDIETLKENNINLKCLSERGVEIFFTQVFRDNFFHADMHPGNIFVSYEHPNDPQYLGVDFGIMGSLSDDDKRYLAENFLAFFNRDYNRVAKLHIESNWVPNTTRVEEFEGAIRALCEPIFQRPLNEISFGQLLVRLFQIASRFEMPIQPQLILLQKTLLNVEGLGRQLYPELDLWQTAKPFLEKWIKKQVGPRALLRRVKEQSPLWIEKMPELPELLYNYLQQNNQKPKPITPTQPHKKRRSFFLGAGMALLFSSVYLIIFNLKAHVLSTAIFSGFSAVFLLFAFIS